MFGHLGIRGLLVGLMCIGFTTSVSAAPECTAYCVCNGVTAEGCTKPVGDCVSPKSATCSGAGCGGKPICCCSERIFEPSGEEGGTLVLKLTDCNSGAWCSEICGGGGFLVHGDAEIPGLLHRVMDPESRAQRALLSDWALVDVEMVEGRQVILHPIYGSSTDYAKEGARGSQIEAFMSPGQTTRIFTQEGPPGSIPMKSTVDKEALRSHLREALGDDLLEFEGSKMALTIVLGLDGLVESVQVLYSEPKEFARRLVPELREAYSRYAEHGGNGRTLDVFSPNVQIGGHIGLHFGGSYLLDVHPFRE